MNREIFNPESVQDKGGEAGAGIRREILEAKNKFSEKVAEEKLLPLPLVDSFIWVVRGCNNKEEHQNIADILGEQLEQREMVFLTRFLNGFLDTLAIKSRPEIRDLYSLAVTSTLDSIVKENIGRYDDEDYKLWPRLEKDETLAENLSKCKKYAADRWTITESEHALVKFSTNSLKELSEGNSYMESLDNIAEDMTDAEVRSLTEDMAVMLLTTPHLTVSTEDRRTLKALIKGEIA
ncbi:hypothetical protein ACFL0Z_01455 [Patescibacteria group bacterium]